MNDLSIDGLVSALAGEQYLADRELATVLYLALELGRPLLLEGEPGVGKTDVAVRLARVLDTDLIRLQCYEGIDVNTAVYEWDYPRQMLAIRMLEAQGETSTAAVKDIFTEEFLLARPLLRAVRHSGDRPPVLLVDEIDRADAEFEAFLLELLSDFAVTVPEIGTLRAKVPPIVVLTSNRTRDVHEALKRRCFYHWIDFPDREQEVRILEARVPDLPEALAGEIAEFVERLRALDLQKAPGIAETLDWAAALLALGTTTLTAEQVERTLGALLKYEDDVRALRQGGARRVLEAMRA